MGASRVRRLGIDSSLLGFVLAACVALSLVAMTQWLAAQQRRASAWALQSQEVLGVIAATRAALVDVQNGHRGFTIEGTPEVLQPYEQGAAALAALSPRLRELLRDGPQQQSHLAEFERLLPQRLATAARIIEARRTGGIEAAQQIIRTGAPALEMAQLRRVLDAMEDQQEVILHQRAAEQQAALSRLSLAAGGVAFLLLPALAVLYRQNRRRLAAQQGLAASEERFRRLSERLEVEVAQRTQELRASNANLEQAQRRLQQLSARMVEHQEQERRRLAYELHEDMAQSMSAIRIDLERARNGAASADALQEAIRLLDALIAQTREMVRRLRPTMLDDLGLAEAIEGELAVHARRQGWQVKLEVEPQDFPSLPPQLATACFRIAQEALANAAWHAHARHVQVALRAPAEGGLVLAVEDDGVGFDVEQQLAAGHEADSFGLLFMRERARQVGGVVDMRGGSGGQGVRVQLSVPVWRVSAV